MRFGNRSSFFNLLRLAFGEARFNPLRLVAGLLLIGLFSAGSFFLVTRLHKYTLKSAPVKDIIPKKSLPSKKILPDTPYREFLASPEFHELRQKEKQKKIRNLKSKLEGSSSKEVITDIKREVDPTRRTRIWDKEGKKKLAYHSSILEAPDDEKLILKYKQIDSERTEEPLPKNKENPPPPPEPKSTFWSELEADFRSVIKDIFGFFL
jgi:hypothetical protein